MSTTIAVPIIEPANPKGLTDRQLRQAALFAVSQLTCALRGERYMTRAEVDTADGILREWFARGISAMIARDSVRNDQ